jgi:hypothetical protein
MAKNAIQKGGASETPVLFVFGLYRAALDGEGE